MTDLFKSFVIAIGLLAGFFGGLYILQICLEYAPWVTVSIVLVIVLTWIVDYIRQYVI